MRLGIGFVLLLHKLRAESGFDGPLVLPNDGYKVIEALDTEGTKRQGGEDVFGTLPESSGVEVQFSEQARDGIGIGPDDPVDDDDDGDPEVTFAKSNFEVDEKVDSYYEESKPESSHPS
jgi:hypothetical protein